jgi:hypothetical protein
VSEVSAGDCAKGGGDQTWSIVAGRKDMWTEISVTRTVLSNYSTSRLLIPAEVCGTAGHVPPASAAHPPYVHVPIATVLPRVLLQGSKCLMRPTRVRRMTFRIPYWTTRCRLQHVDHHAPSHGEGHPGAVSDWPDVASPGLTVESLQAGRLRRGKILTLVPCHKCTWLAASLLRLGDANTRAPFVVAR